MDLNDSLLLLMRKQLELETEEQKVKRDLEKILFSKPFNYETIEVPNHGLYVYPCLDVENFQSIHNSVEHLTDKISKKYFLVNAEEKTSFQVEEVASLKNISKDFVWNGIYCTILNSIIFHVSYIVTLGDFKFKFSKDVPEEELLKNHNEVFSSKLFYETLEPVTFKNEQIENNFSDSIAPFLYENQPFSFEDVLSENQKTIKKQLASNLCCHIEISRITTKKPISFNLKCNEAFVEFNSSFQQINYIARILLQTNTGYKKVVEFSADSYCIPSVSPIEEPEYIEVKKLFLPFLSN